MNKFIPQYEPLIGYSEKKAIKEYIDNPGFLTEYKKTWEFEQRIAEFLNVKHCIVVNNGTISLSLALLALGIQVGDEVIVPNLTMIATANAVKLIGAEPIFVDVENNLLMNFKEVDKLIFESGSQIKAIIFVSLNGRSYSSTKYGYFKKWKEKGIKLIEDGAQAFGSKNYHYNYIGNDIFDITSFSFSMPKIITTGQGGALVTNNDELSEKLRKLKDFGRSCGGNDVHNEFGINSKFTELQAIIGIEQLKDIHFRMMRKKEMFALYKKELEIDGIEFIPTDLNQTTPWFIDIFIKDREKLMQFLKNNNIETRPIYSPITKQLSYQEWNDLSFPIAENYSKKGLWLPSSLNLKDEEITYVCQKIKEFYNV